MADGRVSADSPMPHERTGSMWSLAEGCRVLSLAWDVATNTSR